MTREEKIVMYEHKKSFVFCLGCLYRAEHSIGVKQLQYAYDIDTGEEKVRIFFDGGAIKEKSVNADSILALQKDILEAIG